MVSMLVDNTHTIQKNTYIGGFDMPSLVNTDIALLAADAAIDIDNMLSGRAFEREAPRRLAALITIVVGVDIENPDERPAMEADTFLILCKAANGAGIGISSHGDFFQEMKEITKLLSDENLMEQHRWIIKAIYQFCLKLSIEIAREKNYRHAKSM